MRVLIQRVKSASVQANGELVGEIQQGLVCFVGFGVGDTVDEVAYCSRRMLNARLWPDAHDKQWKESVLSRKHDVLIVSQFTLYGSLASNKPDFHRAMAPELAQDFYKQFCIKVREQHSGVVAEGIFREYMTVSLVNDGPVTMFIDSKERSSKKPTI